MTQAEFNAMFFSALRNASIRDYVRPLQGAPTGGSYVNDGGSGGLSQGTGNGLITENSLIDDGRFQATDSAGGPRICCHANRAGAPAANELCQSIESYNHDPFGFQTVDSDGLWKFFNTVRATVANLVGAASAAGCRFGITLGSPWGPNATNSVMNEQDVHIALYWDFFTGVWNLRVCNKWASAGHRTKTVTFSTPGGLAGPSLPFSSAHQLEIRWFPGLNNSGKIEAWICNQKAYTFTDAQDGQGDTPIHGITLKAEDSGSTIKGGGIFAMSSATDDSLTAVFWGLHCETWVYGDMTPSP